MTKRERGAETPPAEAPATGAPVPLNPLSLWSAAAANWFGFMAGFTSALLRPPRGTTAPTPAAHAAASRQPPPAPEPVATPAAGSQPAVPRTPVPEPEPKPPSPQGVATEAYAPATPEPLPTPPTATAPAALAAPAPELAGIAPEPQAGSAKRKAKPRGVEVAQGDALVEAMTRALRALPDGAAIERPGGLDAEGKSGRDDLSRIKGIGGRMQDRLNALGVYRFEQIASWSEAEAAWIEAALKFPGRIGREDWIGQAKRLLVEERRHEGEAARPGEGLDGGPGAA